MLFRFCLYGFLKNQRYFEPFLMLVLLKRGFSFLDIGWLVAGRELTINVLEIPSGAIADSFGRRGSMVASFALYLVSFACFHFAATWWTFLGAMIVFGAADSFRTGAHKAMIFEWLKRQGRENERTKVYGFTRSWSKLGSATSSVLAALLVAWLNDLWWVFVISAVPYAANLINLATYPAELDGEHRRGISATEAWRRLRASLFACVSRKELRGLIAESANWEGYFVACKDYLQPILATAAAVWWLGQAEADEPRTAALLIGPVYFVLHLLSAWASRASHRVADAAGSLDRASAWLWLAHGLVAVVLCGSGFAHWTLGLALGFVLLHAGQNLWRPILISRFDDHGEAESGATLLSVESQARRVGALALAPLVGWLLDRFADDAGPSYWPLGLVGVGVTMLALAVRSTTVVRQGSSREGRERPD